MRQILRYVLIIWLINVALFIALNFSPKMFDQSISETVIEVLTGLIIYPAPVFFILMLLVWALHFTNYKSWICKSLLSIYTLVILYIAKFIFYLGFYNGDLSWKVVPGLLYEALDFYQGGWLLFGIPTLVFIWAVRFPKKRLSENYLATS